MAYTRRHWVDYPDTSTPINADALNNIEDGIEESHNIQLLAVYPIGSIYMSVNSTNPSTLFGGTWVAWGTGRVPVGVDTSQTEFNTVEKTGGSKFLQNHIHYMGKQAGRGSDASWGFPSEQNTNMGDIYTQTPVDTYGNAITTGDSGNLQPYITCYMWKRTA